jgi:hypothetical protein
VEVDSGLPQIITYLLHLYPTWEQAALQDRLIISLNKCRSILMNRKLRQLALYLPSQGDSLGVPALVGSNRGSNF